MPFNFDLHTHSLFSGDGVSSPEDLIAAARAKGLHGIALTDHNTCDAVTYMLEKGLMRLDGQPVDGFLVLPGVEITTADGHLLCIGAEQRRRSEEHTSELQSRVDLVCRLLLEKKKKTKQEKICTHNKNLH